MMANMEAAWSGWQEYITEGKLAAVFLVALFFLWFGGKKIKQKSFVVFATLTAVLCLCPLTAAVLLFYQTRFYDYTLAWSVVPVTALIAFAFVYFLEEGLQGRKKPAVIGSLLILVGMLAIGGGLGVSKAEKVDYRAERQQTETVILALEERFPAEWVIWAPAEIMEYARDVDSRIQVLYGRNMWDAHLNAYTYDTYPEVYRNMYLWMTRGWDRGELTDEEIARAAAASNANCILLPGDIEEEITRCFEEELGVKAEQLGDYILFVR